MDSKLIRVRLLKSLCNFSQSPVKNSKGQLNVSFSFDMKQNLENDKLFNAQLEITIIGKQIDIVDDIFDLNIIMAGEYESKAKPDMEAIEKNKYKYLLPLVPLVHLHTNDLLTRLDIGSISIKQEFFYSSLEESCALEETKRPKVKRPTKTKRQ
ncbi:MAG: hypothetical protein Q8L79_18160 [Methylobacter sp.]|uniref:hypothetical protein n=1 Tax=Methylobacter sp. TaxID=2051955 RepID=UPI0027308637|nr:hypothetical protein [Methylobacter sp.]MDP1667033.1 hypothetical protein [Methylobacter sp.]